MITAEAAAESAIHTKPEAEAATGAPELEEPPWPWVSPGPSGKGAGRVAHSLGRGLQAPAVLPAP